MNVYQTKENIMLINFTNHPYNNWLEQQKEAAKAYGKVIDLAFPQVSPYATREELMELGDTYLEKILAYYPKAVLCQGEFGLVYYMVNQLMAKDIIVVSACSERKAIEVKENESILKKAVFEFVQFREYNK